jgi:hypothetical protein
VLLGDDGIESVEGEPWTPMGTVIRSDLFGDDPVRNVSIAAAIADGMAANGCPLIDGLLDNVFVSHVEGKLLVLNHGREDAMRELRLPAGGTAEVWLPANTIVEVPLT